jgi:CBS domain-containing protein
MTKPVVSVSEQTSAREIGDLMMKQRIKRVPVLREACRHSLREHSAAR